MIDSKSLYEAYYSLDNKVTNLLNILPTIKGEKGEKGEQGIQGIQGIQGPQGEGFTSENIANVKKVPTLEQNIADINSSLETKTNLIYSFGKENLPYKYNGCVVSLVDDDAKSGFLTNLKPLLDSRGVKCSLGVITGSVGNTGFLSKDELLQLQSEGYDISSHSHSHSSDIYQNNIENVSSTVIENDLKQSFEWLKINGFLGCDNLIYPWGNFGTSSVKYKSIARKYFKYGVNTFSKYNVTPVDNMYLDRYFINKTKTFDEIKSTIDEAFDNNAWLILGSHSYSVSEFDSALFGQVLDYIISKNIPILSLSEGIKLKGNAISCGEYTSSVEDKVFIAKDGSNNIGIKIYSNNILFNEDTPITSFQPNCKTSFISTTNTFGVGGVIETFRTSAKYYSYQTFTPYNINKIYMRKWDDINMVFGAWVEFITNDNIQNKIVEFAPIKVNKGAYTGTMNDSIMLFEQYKETICQLTNAQDILTNTGGVMKVYRGNTNFSYATFFNINGDMYTRRWSGSDSSGIWTTWKKVTYS